MSDINELIELRKKTGLSQRDLAKLLGLKRGWLSHAETGRIRVTPSFLEYWRAALLACERQLRAEEERRKPFRVLGEVSATHNSLECPSCERVLLDDPPASWLFNTCVCGWGS